MTASIQWQEAQIVGLTDLSDSVREFCIQPIEPVQAYAPGSHIELQVLVDGQPQQRSYSLIGEGDQGGYRIAVKRLDQGRGGSMAMWRLSLGDRLRIASPKNHFSLSHSAPHYVLIAGGIGVTPLVSMAQSLMQRRASVQMLYAAKTSQDWVYAQTLQQCLGDRLNLVTGQRIDFAREIAKWPQAAQVYFCGPAAMLESLRHAWAEAGRAAPDLRFETFASSGRLPSQAFSVRVPRHGIDITVAAHTSLLDALREQGVPVLHECLRGECGLCALDVVALDGQIDHRDVFLSAEQKTANERICACVSRAVGSITLDSAYRQEAA